MTTAILLIKVIFSITFSLEEMSILPALISFLITSRVATLFNGEFTTRCGENRLNRVTVSFFTQASPSIFSRFLISVSLFSWAKETKYVVVRTNVNTNNDGVFLILIMLQVQ